MKLGLLTRCKDEFHIEEFVAYYLSQGVDQIHIIDDNSIDKSIYQRVSLVSNVHIHYDENIIDRNIANRTFISLKTQYDWLIYIDVDEYIVTKKNSKRTIKEEIIKTFHDVDLIKVPWVMMSGNNQKISPKNILKTITFRWNHDKRHPNKVTSHKKFRCRYEKIECKSIFRPNKFKAITDHYPKMKLFGKKIKVVDSIRKTKNNLDPFYKNLREPDIADGFLLCYHYRSISEEHAIEKLKTNLWYQREKFTVQDLLSNDYSEILDESVKLKSVPIENYLPQIL